MGFAARVVAAVLALGACASGPEVKDTSGNPEVRDKQDAETKLGVKVRVLGEAVNAKLSAAVDVDGWVVYLLDIRAWPDTIEGKRVEATGILGKNENVAPPDAAGVQEPVHVLREAVYLVLDD